MITTKQRTKLRALANPLDTILQVGKGGITDATVNQTIEALVSRELIKLRVLETCPLTVKEAAQELSKRCRADVVQVIGSRFVLYKRNEKEPKIEI